MVSAGYLRLFADGERIRLIDKSSRQALPNLVGVKDTFVRSHFNSIRPGQGLVLDQLEDDWQLREDAALPLVRHGNPRRPTPIDEEAIKLMMAVHFARSYAYREVHDRIAVDVLRDYLVTDRANRPKVRDQFRNMYGRDPNDGELTQLAIRIWDEKMQSNSPFVESMVRAFNYAIDRFSDFRIQFVVSLQRKVGFVTGDCPVIISSADGRQGGPRDGVSTRLTSPAGPVWCSLIVGRLGGRSSARLHGSLRSKRAPTRLHKR